jgi:hypothetical protein
MKKFLPLIISIITTLSIQSGNASIVQNWSSIESGSGNQQTAGTTKVNGLQIVAGNFLTNYETSQGITNSIAGSNDCFITAYNEQHQLEWSLAFGNSCHEQLNSIDADPASGIIYVTGSFYNTLTIASKSVTSNGATDIFIAAFNESGNILWLQSFGGTGSDEGVKCVVDINGNLVLVANTNAYQFPNSDQVANGSAVCIAKFSNTGSIFWSVCESVNNSGNVKVLDLFSDENANIYITGHFNGTLMAGFNGAQTFQSQNQNIWIAKYNNSGNPIFYYTPSSVMTSTSGGTGIISASNGNIFIAAFYEGTFSFAGKPSTGLDRNLMLLEMNGNGNPVNVTYFESIGFQQSGKIVITDNNYIAVSGYFLDMFAMNGNTLYSLGGLDAFVLYTSTINGNPGFEIFSSLGDDLINDLRSEGTEVNISGYFGANQTGVNLTLGSNVYTSNGGSDGFTVSFSIDNNTTGISDSQESVKNVIAYPNPTNGATTIKLQNENEAQIELIDITGRKIMNLKVPSYSNSVQINLSNLNSGFYQLVISENDKVSFVKIEKY